MPVYAGPSFNADFQARLAAFSTQIVADARNADAAREPLEGLLEDAFGLDHDDVKIVYPSTNSPKNAFFQGTNLTGHFKLGVFVRDPSRHAGSRQDWIEYADERLTWRPSDLGFDAIVVAEEPGNVVSVHYRADRPPDYLEAFTELFPTVRKVPHGSTVVTGVTNGGSAGANGLKGPTPAELGRHLAEALNVVLQGPPGTGKTFLADQYIKAFVHPEKPELYRLTTLLSRHNNCITSLFGDPSLAEMPLVWESVQMHPGYTYDDFVRGMTSVSSPDGGLHFEPKDGIFTVMATIAAHRPSRPTLLVLDEINRCNLSSVLGEAIVAIEPSKRDKAVVRLRLPPPKNGGSQVLTIPRGLLLLGTMNTADRSVSLVDFAIRRRFRFLDVPPSDEVIRDRYKADAARAQRVVDLFASVNKFVKDRRHAVGHEYFLTDPDKPNWASNLAIRFYHEVLPLLREYQRAGHAGDFGSHLEAPGLQLDLRGVKGLIIDEGDDLVTWLKGEKNAATA